MRNQLAPLALVLVSLACSDAGRDKGRPQPDPFLAAYEAAQDEAGSRIAAGDPRWLRMPDPSALKAERSGLDRDSGVPWVMVDVDPSDRAAEGRVAGNNAALRHYLDEYGSVPGSRLPWLDQIYNLREQFDPALTHRLQLGGPAVFSPDGQYRMAWRSATGPSDSTQLLLVSADHTRSLIPPVPLAGSERGVRLRWGPQEADVAFLEWTGPGTTTEPVKFVPQAKGYSAVDLRSGLWLRHENPGGGTGVTSTQPIQ